MLAQVVSTSPPSGVTRPSPVTTTRRIDTLQKAAGRTAAGQKETGPTLHGLSLSEPVIQPAAKPRRTGVVAGLALVLFDVLVGVANRVDLLGRVVGNLDAELFLEGHHQLDNVEAVGAEIVDEARVGSDLVFLDAQVLDYDLLHAVGGVAHVMPSRNCGGWICFRPNERRRGWQVPCHGVLRRSGTGDQLRC